MRVDSNYKGLIDEGFRYLLKGDLTSESDIVICLEKPLFVGCK